MSETAPLSEQVTDEHHGALTRKLSTFGNLAITYSGVGAAAGIFSLFGFSLGFSGATMVWGWVIVGLLWGVMSLLFAELSSHYPYAGAVYQWSAILGGRKVGWWVGWIYLFGLLFALTGCYLVLPISVVPLLGLSGSQGQVATLAIFCLLFAAACNAAGIAVLGRFNRYGVILELGVFTAVALLVLVFAPHHQSLSILTNTLDTSHGAGDWLRALLGGGIFVSLWVLLFFETGGTLGEETIDARRKAPKAVLGAWAVTFVSGLIFILAILTAIPDLGTINTTGTPVQDVIRAASNESGATVYLALITCLTLLACTAIFAGAVRHLFSMARDGVVPGARFLSRTSTRTAAPIGAIVVVAFTTALPLLASRTIAVLVTGSVAVMYVAYFLITSVLLVARVKGWPRQTVPFSLGGWGLPLNVVAVVFTAAMMVDLMWPRAATNPDEAGLPVAWWLLGAPLIVGVGYYAMVIGPKLRREASMISESNRAQ